MQDRMQDQNTEPKLKKKNFLKKAFMSKSINKKKYLLNNYLIYNAVGQTFILKKVNGIMKNKFFKKIYFV